MNENYGESPIIKVEVERLDSEEIPEHVRSTAAVLQDILLDQITYERNVSVEEYSDEDSEPENAASRTCNVCFKMYKSEKTLQSHCLLKHPSDERSVRCVACDKTYPSALSLQKHIRYKHLYAHRCVACYRTFSNEDELQRHADSCVVCESPCTDCGKIFTSRLALRNHINYKHPVKSEHRCPYCRRVFTSSRGLMNHLSAVHPPKARSCRHCHKNFSSAPALRSHILYKHTEGFRCSRCRKAFTTQERLDRHCATFHADSQQHCGLCGQSFEDNLAAMNHIFTNHY